MLDILSHPDREETPVTELDTRYLPHQHHNDDDVDIYVTPRPYHPSIPCSYGLSTPHSHAREHKPSELDVITVMINLASWIVFYGN